MVEVTGTAYGVFPLAPRVLWGLAPRYCIDDGVRISEGVWSMYRGSARFPSWVGSGCMLSHLGLYAFTDRVSGSITFAEFCRCWWCGLGAYLLYLHAWGGRRGIADVEIVTCLR